MFCSSKGNARVTGQQFASIDLSSEVRQLTSRCAPVAIQELIDEFDLPSIISSRVVEGY